MTSLPDNPNRLVSVSIGQDRGSVRRVRRQAASAARHGIRFDQVLLGEHLSESTCMSILRDIASDADVLAILVQDPLPAHLHHDRIATAIPPGKTFRNVRPAGMI
jgi:5,10-methylene-tetrahydrofolate dehydrogenase/methenyl tetrahydrofolate cyclohydrolase